MNDLQRIHLLRSVFRKGSGLTLAALAEAADVAPIVFAPSYRKELRPETLERIGNAAERLVHRAQLDGGRLTAWLQGAAVAGVEETLQELLRMKLCAGRCREWLPMASYYRDNEPACKACSRVVVRAAKSPKSRETVKVIRSLLPAAAQADRPLATAVAEACEWCDAERRSFSYRRVAEALGVGEREASRRLAAVGISRALIAKLVQFVALLTALSGDSWATSVRMGRTRELVLRVQRRGA